MPRTLSLTDKALADLEAATNWLTQLGSGPAAWAKLDAILIAIEDLRDHPCRWPPDRHPGVRVLRVFGPGQDRRGFGSNKA